MERARRQKNISFTQQRWKARAARGMHGEKEDCAHQSASALSADAGLVFPNIRPGIRYEPAMAGR